MALNLQLEALTVPFGTEFPPTVQQLLELIAQYEQIIGTENFNGVNFGSTEPSEDNRDKPWFKTSDSGNPLGWFAWNGSSWSSIPIVIASGSTANRPSSPLMGQLYFDTDINVQLIFERSQWRTVDGSPGDVKEVKAASIAEALTNNPGWSEDTESLGMVIGGASDGSGQTYGDSTGAEEVTLELSNLPSSTIDLQSGWGVYSGQFQNGAQPAGVYPIVTGLGAGSTENTGPINPGVQTPVSIIQPTKWYFRLFKD